MPKFAVITGASSGIGAEFARQLSARGYNLLLVARRADRLEKLSDQLTTVCEIMTADLSKKSECLRLAKALEDRRVDLFINNAGFGDCGPFLQTDLDKDLDMLAVNVRALHILTKKIGQKLYKQGFGALLNVGSCAGLMPAGPYMATYYATKAYVVSLTSALAQELREAHSPVYVGCLCPGPVNTEFNAVANVEFALRGITPEYCVRCALDSMARRKTVIVPSPLVAAGMTLGRFLPQSLLPGLVAGFPDGRLNFRPGFCPDRRFSADGSGHGGRGHAAASGNLPDVYLFLHSSSNSCRLALAVRQPIPVVAFPPV